MTSSMAVRVHGAAFLRASGRFPSSSRVNTDRTLRLVLTTEYFRAIRGRPDRRDIRDEWIQRVIREPQREERQQDGRIRRWGVVPEAGGRHLRVILLADGETVHNAFFDRGYEP
jgi:hypothetical protein